MSTNYSQIEYSGAEFTLINASKQQFLENVRDVIRIFYFVCVLNFMRFAMRAKGTIKRFARRWTARMAHTTPRARAHTHTHIHTKKKIDLLTTK